MAIRRAAAVLLAAAVLCGCLTKHVQPAPSLAVQQARAAAAANAARALRPQDRCAAAPATLPSPLVVRFPYGEAAPDEDGRPVLDTAALWLACHPAATAWVTAEADASGSPAVKRELPARRVQGVRDYLAARGVAAPRVLTAPPAAGQTVAIQAKGRGW